MPVLEDRLLSLGAKNSTVYAFKQLVNNCIGIKNEVTSNNSGNSLPARYIAELDQELYDKAAGLPEAQSISFKYLDDASKFQYGNFKGGNTYKTFDGEIDQSNKNAKPQQGWVIIDNSSAEYCLFVNNGKSIIIAITDFEPTPIIEDFTPLYEKLCQRKYSGSNSGLHADDIRCAYSLAATFRLDISDLLNNKLYQAWLIYMGAYRIVGEFSLLIKKLTGEKTKNIEKISDLSYEDADLKLNENYNGVFGVYPLQIGATNEDRKVTFNDSAYKEVQAIVYDLPSGNSSNNSWSLEENHIDQLLCYQQPENLSYTSSAGFEAVTARGTQQPFQFYTNANEIRLSFTLRWHIDEARTFKRLDGKSYSLQEIADIAENFTRPWESGSSLTPKLCKVILPGMSEIGYITQAQVQYSGDMTGDFESAGLIDDTGRSLNYDESQNNDQNASSYITSYHYTQLEITFELLIVKDIKLFKSDDINKTRSWSIDSANLEAYKREVKEKEESSGGFSLSGLVSGVIEAANTAATVATAIGGMTDALVQMSTAAVTLVS